MTTGDMKLVTFRTDAHDRAGVLVGAVESGGEHVIDLAHGFAWIEHRAGHRCDAAHVADRYGKGVLGFVENADVARPAADELVACWQSGALPATFDGRVVLSPLADVRLRAPLPSPPSLRDGYAFRAHVEAARRARGLPMPPEFDAFPVFYFSNHRAVVGPGDVRVEREHLGALDYELEAAIVVGRRARNVRAAEADEAIFGMTVMNDWSARALQSQEMKLNLGPAKGKDFATSLGPWLVTVDELLARARRTERGLVFDMEMRAEVNGRLLSRGNLRDMTWTFAQILERASLGVELAPGEVLGSGTCGTGCLLELNGSAAAGAGDGSGRRGGETWLQPGDVVALEIDGLGRLENRVTVA